MTRVSFYFVTDPLLFFLSLTSTFHLQPTSWRHKHATVLLTSDYICIAFSFSCRRPVRSIQYPPPPPLPAQCSPFSLSRSLLSAPVISSKLEATYTAFDLNPTRVRESRGQGFPVFYGDGTEPEVLKTAGIDEPKVRETHHAYSTCARGGRSRGGRAGGGGCHVVMMVSHAIVCHSH